MASDGCAPRTGAPPRGFVWKLPSVAWETSWISDREIKRVPNMSDTNARYRSLFETTPDLVVIMDDRGIVVAANSSLKRVLGYDPDEIVGKPLARLMPERYRADHSKGFLRYLSTGKRKLDWTAINLPGLTADGYEIPLSIAFGEYEEDGRHFFTGILRDVSAEKTAFDRLEFFARVGPALAASSLDYKSTLENLARLAVPFLADWSAVDVMNGDGKLERVAIAHSDPKKIELAHELASRYPPDPDASYGVPQVIRTGRAELVTDINDEFLDRAARDKEHLELIRSLGLRSYLIAPLAAQGHVYGAISLVHAESGRRFTTADLPVMEELGRRAGIAVHNAGLYRAALHANELLEEQAAELEQQTDEAQALTEELESQTAELIQSAEDLRLKSDEAAAANVAKSEFLASMSHELRTPLNAIAGYVELLEMGLRGPVTKEQRSDLERIRVSQHHLLGLINDVLNFAKVDAGKIEYDLQTVALDMILKDCEAMVLPQIHRKRISYTYEECGESVWVAADRDKVQQILINLLSNAIKFTAEGGSLSASCDKTDTEGRVHVTDTGIGIPPEKLDAIFEPFVQIDRSLNQPGQGAGLGLAISRSLARAMGGDIVVISTPGAGSTFTLTLPRAEKPE